MSPRSIPTVFALLLGLVAPASGAEPFLFGSPEIRPMPLPERYQAPLSELLVVNPALARLETHFFQMGDAPRHLSYRACREGAPERTWILDAIRRAESSNRWRDDSSRYSLALGRCEQAQDEASLCRYLLSVTPQESSGKLRDLLGQRILSCPEAQVAEFFASADASDEEVLAFHTRRPTLGLTPRFDYAAATLAREGDFETLKSVVKILGRPNRFRSEAILVGLHSTEKEPERRMTMALGLRNHRGPEATHVYGKAYRSDCLTRKAANERASRKRPAPSASFDVVRQSLHGLGYMVSPVFNCDAVPPPEAVSARFEPPAPEATPNELRIQSLVASLRSHGITRAVHRFHPKNAGSYREHAPLMRRLADQIRPALDPVVFEDRWPALETLELVRGPHLIEAFINGDSVLLGVPNRVGAPVQQELQRLAAEIEFAQQADHYVDAYYAGQRYRFRIRGNLGDFVDVEAAVGAINTMLRATGSDERLTVLEPFDLVELAAGPRELLLRAIADGSIKPAHPFSAALKISDFPGIPD